MSSGIGVSLLEERWPLAQRSNDEAPGLLTGGLTLRWALSDCVDLVGLRPLRSLGGLELHALALVEGPESARLDRAVMDENVRTAAVHGNKAVALLGNEPLNGSLRHETSLIASVIETAPHGSDCCWTPGKSSRPRKVLGAWPSRA